MAGHRHRMRGHRHQHSADPMIAIGIIAGIFVLLFLGALYRCRARSGFRMRYGAVAQTETNLKRSQKKQHMLNSAIRKLEKQLGRHKLKAAKVEAETAQLTSRLHVAKKSDKEVTEEWTQLTERGRQIYGDAWDTPAEQGGVALGTLFAMHKDELQKVQEDVSETLPPWERAKFQQLTARSGKSVERTKPWEISSSRSLHREGNKQHKEAHSQAWGGQSVVINPRAKPQSRAGDRDRYSRTGPGSVSASSSAAQPWQGASIVINPQRDQRSPATTRTQPTPQRLSLPMSPAPPPLPLPHPLQIARECGMDGDLLQSTVAV